MDNFHLTISILSSFLYLFTDVFPFTLNAYQSSDKAILGNNSYTLSCTYTLESNEVLYSIVLQRKRESDSDFVTIVTFQNPSSPLNVTYQDTTLKSRTVATKPTEVDRTAALVFNQIVCDDKAAYKWDATYTDGAVKHAVKNLAIVVRANALFTESGNGRISQTPNTNIEEGDNVTFTCSGDVGNEPVAYLRWFYFLKNSTLNAINASSLAKTTAPTYVASTCSYTRTSTLELMMTKEFHHVVVRCTIQQDRFDQFGDGYLQTKSIPVYYSPRVISMEDETVEEGREFLTLTCTADAYPKPEYYWVLPNGTMSVGPSYTLRNIQLGDNGKYTCVVYNIFKGANHTVTETTYVDVKKKMSTQAQGASTTTATTSTGNPDKAKPSESPRAEEQCHDSAFIILLCIIIAQFFVIGVIMIRICIMKRAKPKEMEESHGNSRKSQSQSARSNITSSGVVEDNATGPSAYTTLHRSLYVNQGNVDENLYTDLQLHNASQSIRQV